MADISIVIAAQDMASGVMQSISRQTKVMTTSVQGMAAGVLTSTKTMAAGFGSLTISLGPLLAAVLSLQAAFAIFGFLRDSVLAFVEAGSPAGKELGASMQLASEAITRLMASVGGLLAPMVKVVAEGIIVFANAASTVMQPAIEGISSAMQGIRPYIDMFLQGIIAAVTGVEVGFTNMGEVVQFAWLSFRLGFMQMIEGTKHTFTQVLPAYIQWFGENAYNMLRDAAVGMVTVITNLGKNLGEFGAAIYMWISGGMQGGLDGLMSQLGETMMVSLTDGFEAQTKALPEIAARQMTAYELELAGQMAQIGGNLGDQFNEKFKARVSAMGGQLALPELNDPVKAEDVTKKLTGGLTQVAEAQSSIAQQLSATESRLLTRGQSEGPMQSVATASQKTAVAAEETRKASDRMVQLLQELVSKNFIVAEAV
jgi:hypothetical protein